MAYYISYNLKSIYAIKMTSDNSLSKVITFSGKPLFFTRDLSDTWWGLLLISMIFLLYTSTVK